jgi:hypothetical protein
MHSAGAVRGRPTASAVQPPHGSRWCLGSPPRPTRGRLATAGATRSLAQKLVSVVDPTNSWIEPSPLPVMPTRGLPTPLRWPHASGRDAGPKPPMTARPPVFLPGGHDVAYPALDGRRWTPVAGVEAARFDEGFIWDVTPSPTGRKLLFVAGSSPTVHRRR